MRILEKLIIWMLVIAIIIAIILALWVGGAGAVELVCTPSPSFMPPSRTATPPATELPPTDTALPPTFTATATKEATETPTELPPMQATPTDLQLSTATGTYPPLPSPPATYTPTSTPEVYPPQVEHGGGNKVVLPETGEWGEDSFAMYFAGALILCLLLLVAVAVRRAK